MNLYKYFFLLVISSSTNSIFSQGDSLPYEMYKEKVVLYTDFGYTSAPFSISNNFPFGVKELKYRNNYKGVIGYGMCYKWFSLRLFHALEGDSKSEEKYGKTRYSGFGFTFNVKKSYWDVDFRTFKGYSILKAESWNSALSKDQPNLIRPATKSVGFSINTWYFFNKNFKMQAVLGKKAHFTREVKSWYLKSTFNAYGISNDTIGAPSVIPTILTDPNNSKTLSNSFSAVDFGVIPGYAYATRKNNWQVSGLFGLGAVIQSKQYIVNGNPRAFIGLAPRYDVRLVGGYSVPRYFVFLVTDIDNKSIRFNQLVYRQSFYSIKLLAGIRLNTKGEKEEKKKKEKKKLFS